MYLSFRYYKERPGGGKHIIVFSFYFIKG